MRRRAAQGVVPDPPERLRVFDAADWPVGPEPRHWAGGDSEPFPWGLACARLAWLRARREWADEQDDRTAARALLPWPT